LSLTKGGGKEG